MKYSASGSAAPHINTFPGSPELIQSSHPHDLRIFIYCVALFRNLYIREPEQIFFGRLAFSGPHFIHRIYSVS